MATEVQRKTLRNGEAAPIRQRGQSYNVSARSIFQTDRSCIQVCRVDVMMQEIGLSSDITMVSPPQGKMRKHGTHHSKTGFHSLNDNSKHLRVHIPYYY